MMKTAYLVLLLTTLCSCHCSPNVTGAKTKRLLSRRKRYLIFPEGSSLQLVFCMTLTATIDIGDIFLYGTTAALAWELPQDPYSPFNHKADPLHRRVDSTKNIYYLDEKGKLLAKVPIEKKPITNPAFAKRSIENTHNIPETISSDRENWTGNMEAEIEKDRKMMHEEQSERDYLKMERFDEGTVEFHRNSRRKLYDKLEVFLKALGLNGRECVLKTLCEIGMSKNEPQGTFIDELVRAVFTLPRGKEFLQEYHREYDKAHRINENCDVLYPDCEGSIKNIPMR